MFLRTIVKTEYICLLYIFVNSSVSLNCKGLAYNMSTIISVNASMKTLLSKHISVDRIGYRQLHIFVNEYNRQFNFLWKKSITQHGCTLQQIRESSRQFGQLKSKIKARIRLSMVILSTAYFRQRLFQSIVIFVDDYFIQRLYL